VDIDMDGACPARGRDERLPADMEEAHHGARDQELDRIGEARIDQHHDRRTERVGEERRPPADAIGNMAEAEGQTGAFDYFGPSRRQRAWPKSPSRSKTIWNALVTTGQSR